MILTKYIAESICIFNIIEYIYLSVTHGYTYINGALNHSYKTAKWRGRQREHEPENTSKLFNGTNLNGFRM